MLQYSHWSDPKVAVLCWRRCSKTWRLRESCSLQRGAENGSDALPTEKNDALKRERRGRGAERGLQSSQEQGLKDGSYLHEVPTPL